MVSLVNSGSKVFLEGNARFLTNYFQQKLDKFSLRMVYFGQNFLQDIHATNEFDLKLQKAKWPARWDPIPVIEEMSFEDESY